MKKEVIKEQHRINEQIRAKEVRLVGDDNIEPKVYPLFQALKMAEDRGNGSSRNFSKCSSSCL